MRLAVVVTIYRRLEYLDEQMAQLSSQTNKDFDLFVCNNTDSEIDIPNATVFHYANKFKMYARFFLIRDYIVGKGYDAVLLIDDDEMLPPNLIDQCHGQFHPKQVKSFWSFVTGNDYWSRRRLRGGMEGDYAGTGGLLSPIELWSVSAIYDAPEPYWIIDDLWLSHCILKYTDYTIRALAAPTKFFPEEGRKATYLSIKKLKSEFHHEYIKPYRRYSESLTVVRPPGRLIGRKSHRL